MSAVLVTLAATFLVQLGYFLWKVSANDNQPKIGKTPALTVIHALLTDWRFMLGLAATNIGWALFIKATSLGDISLVQPLMSAGEFLLVIMAVIFLKERLSSMEWVGVLISILGSIALVWEAEDSRITTFDTTSLILLVIATILIGGILLFISRFRPQTEIFLALVIGLSFGTGAILTKVMTTKFAALGQDIVTWHTLIEPLFLALMAANIFGLILLQAAFQRGRAAIIIPLQVAITNALTVLAGMIVFAEHITLLRAIGIIMIICRTLFIQSEKKP